MAWREGGEIEEYGLSGEEIKAIVEEAGGIFHGMYGYQGGTMNATNERSQGRNPRRGSFGVWDMKIDGPVFKVNTDSTITGYDATWDDAGAFELVTPVLHGEAGMRMLRRILKKMVQAGAQVDRSCGTHINMGINHIARVKRMSNRSRMDIGRRIAEIYSHFQPVFDAISPNCRRSDSTNMAYGASCRPCDTARPFRGRCVVNMLNVELFIMTGRVEFRQPGFTLDANKIEGWSRLLNSVVSCAVNLDHRNYRVPCHNFPRTLEGMVEMLNPGVKANRWAETRIRSLIERYTGYRDERVAVLEVA